MLIKPSPLPNAEPTSNPTPSSAIVSVSSLTLLFKRTAYNFVSLAHDEATVDRTLGILDEVLAETER